ncbi:helix-turn-helix transcriptional regulator [Herpetosiphon giganteus]|uniref:helix-turn-helix transcriptional regulator n=1 Tax=Herpetosiphon giganteus TaxID=2029754 RepID=UPI0019599196|nr:WYL domain-containing transcriptional regulator [Herpetosiphon giganteus]MBM7845828.1 proteasome accessory factor B [Herpetosiphon giganteus]
MSDERLASKAARLRWIERKLYNNPQGLRVMDLAEATGMDRRTIYRDLGALEDMGVPMWQFEGKFGINREDYLSTVRLNLNQTISLFFAARLLAHHSDEQNPHVVAALEKIAASLPDETIAKHLSNVAAQIQLRPTRREYILVLETFTRAWADRRMVKFSYWASNRDEPEERTVAPYVLEVSRFEPASYVIGHDPLRNALRTFKLERVQRAEILDTEYVIPTDFDPYSMLADSWGIMDEGNTVTVRLRFSTLVARRVKESTWHRSQEVIDLPDGGCELSMKLAGTREMRSWVLGWGADVEVLAPADLRAEVAEHAQRMVQQYQ